MPSQHPHQGMITAPCFPGKNKPYSLPRNAVALRLSGSHFRTKVGHLKRLLFDMAIPAKPLRFQRFCVIQMMGFDGGLSTASRADLGPLHVACANPVMDSVASNHSLPRSQMLVAMPMSGKAFAIRVLKSLDGFLA